ncbi:phytoene desaturase family protein [Gloeobacter kilaueensis]|uniref:FAD-binding dehydrogenase n=1 Tax=Gloeobacter kilaueensis (strain ATCC BAA-2537 / CCAP 1431/1 / ULC 316 / JS1) TaxID=1183438 RepID=U5QDY2_GLOK1|nr:NAD(P)/FAD-dependent oxidoreductase [Gloeobacter kilaueensis]AGY57172.1 FAD-binding dehydrogenase [Gloeobacter kilaueensis JS1]
MFDTIIVGGGIGGLCAAALLARHGRRVLVCESHTIAGGAAHAFRREGFHFDSGPSFHCGLGDPKSLNPLRQILAVLGESLPTVPYSPFAHYHFPDSCFAVFGDAGRYSGAIAGVTQAGARQFERFARRLLPMYEALADIPILSLRADLGLLATLLGTYLGQTLKLLTLVGDLRSSTGQILDRDVRDPWVRRLVDLECFLLSGLTAHGTVAPEFAFMWGERCRSPIDYPIGGGGAIVEALVRALKRWGGEIRLGAHVQTILIEQGRVAGVQLVGGERLDAPVVISNASLWDTYTKLVPAGALNPAFLRSALALPAVDSFMHLHLGIRAEGLESLSGHHVVVHADPLTHPGHTCMISIPSVWDPNLAPAGHHVLHAYSLEPFAPWQRDNRYHERKRERALPLYRAIERIIPDLKNRIVLELIGTPLTHARYLRRFQGSYGPAIMPAVGTFPGPATPITGLYRVGDTTLPGIGLPAVAASAILCVNSLVEPERTAELVAASTSSPLKAKTT